MKTEILASDIASDGYYKLDNGMIQWLSGHKASEQNSLRRKAGLGPLPAHSGNLVSVVSSIHATTISSANVIPDKISVFRSEWHRLRKEMTEEDFCQMLYELFRECEKGEDGRRMRNFSNQQFSLIFHKMTQGDGTSPVAAGDMKDFLRHRLLNKIGDAPTLAKQMIKMIEEAVAETSPQEIANPDNPESGSW